MFGFLPAISPTDQPRGPSAVPTTSPSEPDRGQFADYLATQMQSPVGNAATDKVPRDGSHHNDRSHGEEAEAQSLRGSTKSKDDAAELPAPDGRAHRVPEDKRDAKVRSESREKPPTRSDDTWDAEVSAAANATTEQSEKAAGSKAVSGDVKDAALLVSKASHTKATVAQDAGEGHSPPPVRAKHSKGDPSLPAPTSGSGNAASADAGHATEHSGKVEAESAKTPHDPAASGELGRDQASASKAAIADAALRTSASGEIDPSGVAGSAFGTTGRTTKNARGSSSGEGETGVTEALGVKAVRNTKATPQAVSAVNAQRGDGEGSVLREIQVDLSENASQPRADTAAGGETGRSDSAEAGTFATRMGTPPADTASRPPTLAQAGAALGRRLNADVGQNIVRQARIMLQESGKAEVRLIIRPPELGRVRIQLQMDNGHIAGRILVDNGSVREVVEQNLPALQRAFEEAGLEMGDLEVSTGDARQETGAGETSRHARSSRDRRQGADQFDHSVEAIATYDYGGHRVNLVA